MQPIDVFMSLFLGMCIACWRGLRLLLNAAPTRELLTRPLRVTSDGHNSAVSGHVSVGLPGVNCAKI
jgi:hypothetical protein